MTRGRLYIISAPSGAGKTTVISAVRSKFPEIKFSISCTTRKKRANEIAGESYIFIPRCEFEEKISAGNFLEWAEYCGELYGTLKAQVDDSISVGESVLLDVDVQGAISIKKIYPEAVTIFLLPPSMEALEARLRKRCTNDEVDLQKRIARANEEMKIKDSYDHQVINDDIDRAAAEIEAIIATSC